MYDKLSANTAVRMIKAVEESKLSMMPVAIVGMGCRFPGKADSVNAFWQLLLRGEDATCFVPEDRWNGKQFFSCDSAKEPGTVNNVRGGFVKDIADFDAGFFGISPREAALMDPQQRILLEATFNGLEDGGLTLEETRGKKVGVFIGITSTDYAEIQRCQHNREFIDAHTNTGTTLAIAANRLSYFFDFKGPSLAIDTACSSSLTAVHLACQNLASGESSIAVAGGVNALLKPEATIGMSAASMVSPDGRCKTFDISANGFVRAEGAGIVVLKPLESALRDQDRIYAVIKGSAINQDGHTASLTMPNSEAQVQMLEQTYRVAGIDPGEMRYIEAHGTGTPVGDPLEVAALGKIFGVNRQSDNPCYVGSVKTNIGHLEAAAGIAGLIKAALTTYHGVIPAMLNFHTENPKLGLSQYHLSVPTRTVPWPDDDVPRRVGVNSFGFGGANAHVVIEQAPTDREEKNYKTPVRETSPNLLTVSARNEVALQLLLNEHLSTLQNQGQTIPLDSYCRAAARRRSHHAYRLALVVEDRDQLISKLQGYHQGLPIEGVLEGLAEPLRESEENPVFVFSGMGPQWWGMGQELYRTEPVFRQWIERCDAALAPYGDWSLCEEMLKGEDNSRMAETAISQPANFALQVALARLWNSWGIKPSAIVGHSAGEVAAAYIAGMFSLEEAAQVIYHRSSLQQRTSGQGSMLATGLSVDKAQSIKERFDKDVSIAAMNSPSSVTVVGDTDCIETLNRLLLEDGVFSRPLQVDIPFHSHFMEPLAEDLLASLENLKLTEPTAPLYSTVTGGLVSGFAYDNAYWWRNVREPVRFAQATHQLLEHGYRHFLELSPHPVLSSSIIECLAHHQIKGSVVSSLRRRQDERREMLTNLSKFYIRGHSIHWQGVYAGDNHHVSLPQYPWQRERYWQEGADSMNRRLLPTEHPLLGTRIEQPEPCWSNDIGLYPHHYLQDHQVREVVLFPAAAYIELALAAGREFYDSHCLQLNDLVFEQVWVMKEGQRRRCQVRLSSVDQRVSLHTRELGEEAAWLSHMQGRITQIAVEGQRRFCLDKVKKRCHDEVSDRVYTAFAERGLHYGPHFQGIERLWCHDDEALASLRPFNASVYGGGQGEAEDELDAYLLHPALLDACLQAFIGTLLDIYPTPYTPLPTYLPVGLETLRLYERLTPGEHYWVYARRTVMSPSDMKGDIYLLDSEGKALAEIRQLGCRQLNADNIEKDNWLYAFEWRRQDSLHGIDKFWADRITPSVLAASIASDITQLSQNYKRDHFYAELEPSMDAIAIAFACQAFVELGTNWQIGQVLTLESLCSELNIVPSHRRLTRRLLQCMALEGWLEAVDDDSWSVRRLYSGPEPLEMVTEHYRHYQQQHPEVALLEACGKPLARVLRGELDPVEIMFPNGEQRLTESIYSDSATFRIYNDIIGQLLQTIVKKMPEGRRLRILEIGAGSGTLASLLLKQLPTERIHYTFTDISSAFLVRAKDKFADLQCLDFQLLDIEKDPLSQGFDTACFDIVLAGDVLHATSDLTRTAGNAAELLVPDGLLILLEVTRPPYRFDLTFGQLKGWWAFEDEDLRPDHCCISPSTWTALLERCGQYDIRILSDRPDQQASAIQSIIISSRCDTMTDTTRVQAEYPWLVVMDQQEIGDQIVAEFQRQLRLVVPIALAETGGLTSDSANRSHWVGADLSSIYEFIDGLIAEYHGIAGLVYLSSLDAPAFDQADTVDPNSLASQTCLNLINLVQALDEFNPGERLHFVLATRDLQQVTDSDMASGVFNAPLWGLGRVIASEYPVHRVSMLDLPARPEREDVMGLYRETQRGANHELEVAVRRGERYVARLQQPSQDALAQTQCRPVCLAEEDAYCLDVRKPGDLSSLFLKQVNCRDPGPGEVEIEVHYASLNFHDLMKVLDIYPKDGNAFHLGDECSGIIRNVGPGVEGLAVGDRVAGFAFGFSSTIVTLADLVVPIPDHLGLQEAATIPMAFATAWYALHELGNMTAGERVLIHAAAGGVGLAAVQIAQRAGLEVFATASSEEKYQQLRAMGIKQIFNSRTLAFYDEIYVATEGQGVDLVLNSLADEFIPASLKLLSPYGRFLEIGKADIYANTPLGLYPFRKNLSFFAIDLGRMFHECPQRVQGTLKAVMAAFAKRHLTPLPIQGFDIDEAEDAFRTMAQAKHIGKIVFAMRQEQKRAVKIPNRNLGRFQQNASYLLTGGLGGFGLAVAEWMAETGAGHLILGGRRTTLDDTQRQRLASIEANGCKVSVVSLDVTDKASVEQVLQQHCTASQPLKGVMHMAMVLDDRFIRDQTEHSFNKVFAPKARGAWNLHHATADSDLDFFVMFSSFAAVVGNPGQSNYVAGNQFLDALATYRRACGLPALTIAWGPIADVGYVAQHEDIQRHFERQGTRPFSVNEAIQALATSLHEALTSVCALHVDWSLYANYAPDMIETSRFQHFVVRDANNGAHSEESAGILNELSLCAPAERQALVERWLSHRLAELLSYNLADFDPNRPLAEVGMDSLISVEMAAVIKEKLGLKLPSMELTQSASVVGLATRLLLDLNLDAALQTQGDQRNIELMSSVVDRDTERVLILDRSNES
ncbi:SDR family NAD(P)-dependent oxidoreductase [Microbulbifer sp. 2205BS26-8]|uniref:SDR family NAD(P)-dependent oxidoreductase n=1 Tax=Microbulbifer sp. 2205BS26-8 TaxID=3064386 RepID=UPI00273FF094|nr:SDR family NAD(P)-dependent oxidoreductase [Microbulbifer sp. 2205BS26-8]MDP5209829.1 SDR family NAD(P)-dependent oxidoreductase [Microbulbifer sp. 2205BS26-8]